MCNSFVLAITGQLELKCFCMEEFLTLINTKNFVIHCYPSPTVQEVEISREDEVVTWSTKSEGGGIGPVKPVYMVFSDDESFLSRFC